MNRFLRMGDLPALWRDSKSYKMRGQIVQTRAKVGVFINEDYTQNIRPYDLKLAQNYPNPFNPSTQIEFYLPNAVELSLDVYNMLGQKVASITNGFYQSGIHTVTFDASVLSSGVYVYTLKTSDQMHSRKFTLIK